MFAADKYICDLLKASITNIKQTLKEGALAGSSKRFEGYHDSDLNSLASVILRQYTTVTNKC